MPVIKEKVEFDACPFCGSTNLELDKDDRWTCLSCFEQWDKEGIK